MDSEQKLMLYRIVQEQINNCLKYADASTIEVQVTMEDSRAGICVRDNGKGFDPSQLREGTGMRNIRSRLELFQGEVKFLSRPGEGCTLQAHFPLKANH
jgi:signal transduction histidine kinase